MIRFKMTELYLGPKGMKSMSLIISSKMMKLLTHFSASSNILTIWVVICPSLRPMKRSELIILVKEVSVAKAHYAATTVFPIPGSPIIKKLCFPS